MNRSRLPFLALALGAAVLAGAGGAHPASAAPKAAAPASPSPAASPTAAPEPLDRAIPRLEAALKKDPGDRESAQLLAQDYLRVGRPDLTLGITQKLLASGTKTGAVYYFDGLAQQALGRPREALADFENASNLEPTNYGVLAQLTQAYLNAGRGGDAERVAKRALTFNKNEPDAYVTYGTVLANERKFSEAREQFEAAAKLDPKNAHPLVLEAKTYADERAVALAQSVYDRALAADPTSIEALLGKAQLAGAQHDVKTAIPLYDKVIALAQDDGQRVAVLTEEAKLYAQEHMDADAERTLQSSIQKYPSVLEAHVAYGDFLAYKGDKNGAEREWTAALGPNRDGIDALSRLGQFYAAQKQPERSLQEYQRLTEVDGGNSRAWLYYAAALVANHRYDKARDAYKRSYAMDHTAEALVGLAGADYQARDYRECARVLEGLDKAAPQYAQNDLNLLYTLGDCYRHTNQPQKARATYTRLLSYVKPGTPAASEVKARLSELDHGRPAPRATAEPKKH